MTRTWKIVLAILAVAVVIGAFSFHGLHDRIRRLALAQLVEEKARQEVLSQPISTPTDAPSTAKIFWASGPDTLSPVEIQLPLSADPVERSRQLLQALIANPPTPGQRTLPADATVLGFYVLPDGTAIADFSDTLASEVPSGILSEGMAVNSIAQTLANNVPKLYRLKILIHGQQVDTLAGNVDLTGFFDLNSPTQPASSDSSSPPADGKAIPPAPQATPNAPH
jgi:hypothetical protein